jgi:hypothetical protein
MRQMMSDMTAKYIEALCREGENFNYLDWFRRVQEEKAQKGAVATVVTRDDPLICEDDRLDNMSVFADASLSSKPISTEVRPLIRGALNRIASRSEKKDRRRRLNRRLEKIRDVWRSFQASRSRDAVYDYLEAVLAAVERYRGRAKARRFLRSACKLAGLSHHQSAEIFATLIRCTSDDSLDRKMVSKYSRALRYAAGCKVRSTRLKAFLKKLGGVNACAERLARHYKA